MKLDDLARQIISNSSVKKRFIVALAGPPASGKTTLAQNLCESINVKVSASRCVIVPMDGFHLDNKILDNMGIRHIKGAPQTFDAERFIQLMQRIRGDTDTLAIPEFNRELDAVVIGGRCVNLEHRIIIVEGNYLLLNEAPWDQLHAIFDLSVMLAPTLKTLEERLIWRWQTHGYSAQQAKIRASSNDIPNAKYAVENSIQADITVLELVD